MHGFEPICLTKNQIESIIYIYIYNVSLALIKRQSFHFLFFGKVMLWASHPNIIAFSKPNNGKYENQLLIWKVLSFLCTLSRLHLLCPNCPSISPAQHHLNLHVTLSHLEAFSHLSSFPTTQNFSHLSSETQIQNSKAVSKRALKVQENSRKTKWSSSGQSRYPKIETLTSKWVLNSQIRVQDSSIGKK